MQVTSDFLAEPDPSRFDHDLIVRTRHAAELSWLFMELRDTFAGWLDYTSWPNSKIFKPPSLIENARIRSWWCRMASQARAGLSPVEGFSGFLRQSPAIQTQFRKATLASHLVIVKPGCHAGA